ncbi:MAG TPA: kelch repeat-containing protein [Chitinophagaceae bacterium]|nr:kelch repeat-containing protein [Chitinophagaceae bacterium]
MKTTIFFIGILLFATSPSFTQIDPNSPWTWVKGDNTVDQSGIYGSQGVTTATNKPGARVFSTTWSDSNGNLWLFGGNGYSSSNLGYLNDLWKYNTYTNEWTWMKGDNTISQYAVYGTQGNAATNNKPGATNGSVSWTDLNGNLWLFGGYGYTNNNFGFLNSLWKFNPATNQWTWMKGDKAIDKVGVYGTLGTESSTNKPGARYGSLTWIDSNNNLWLFGGYGYDGSSIGILNDLWKFNIQTNKWTWINGDNIIGKLGIYGTRGVPATSNKPGARYLGTSWTDNDGNFWVFGGYGYGESGTGSLNDLWKYNPATNQWTWINGDKTVNNNSVYGVKGIADSNNKPGSRYESCSWKDSNGNLWLFGGFGFDTQTSGNLNDFWKYNFTDNTWTWIKGDSIINQLAIYGVQGTPNSINKSGSRTASVSWTDNNGNLWLFGGDGFDGSTSGVLNDLWKVSNLETVLPLKILEFTGSSNKDIITLKWKTADETGLSHYIVQRSFDGTNFSELGQLNSKGNTLNYYGYTDNNLAGSASQLVFYRLKMVNTDGKFSYSNIIRFDLRSVSGNLKLFPNPATVTIQVSYYQDQPGKSLINFIAANGSIVKTVSVNNTAGQSSVIIDISSLPSSWYAIQINTAGNTLYTRFIKQ